MNLVVCGPIDAALMEALAPLVQADRRERLHATALRFERVADSPSIRSAIGDLCWRAKVDHAFVDRPPGFGSFGLLAMDMDSTLITIECIDEIADYVGKKAEVAVITEAAMRGDITDFAESLRRRVALLAGTDESVLERVFEERLRLSAGADVLLAAARAANVHTLLVSGGFTYFTDRLVASLPLDVGHANRLEIVDGKLTGQVIEPIFDADAKRRTVEATLNALRLPRSAALVIGDGSNDIPMMNLVDQSVSYHGKHPVVEAARHAIRFGNLATVVDYFT